ncbi:putative ABC transport system ATP-binding protein [Garciella nitratireducens DSM 15102]|uniref:Putative ABC transport system ATP-binding protein n=1 Tax=Garciella nitratireducens DSM 15102 TaxID=1121911 RepID=A0A1T4N707_9FIRM|nr:putative ABC transport system ATP-binding protein [Garciella nitratireducens DSM 15102]
MEIVLETQKLKKEYGGKGLTFIVLEDIDLKVYKGEFLGIMGPYGAIRSREDHSFKYFIYY